MFPSWMKRGTKCPRQLSGFQEMVRRGRFRPFLERLETRTMPAFVTGLPLGIQTSRSGAEDLVIGDFNNDGKLDVVATKLDNGFVLYEGNGDGTFQNSSSSPISVVYPTGDSAYSVAAADLNGDGNLDVVTCDQNLGNVYVSLGNGNGTFQNVVQYPGVPGASQLLIADFDGNGTPDILVSGINANQVGVLLNQGNGTFVPGTTISTPLGGGVMTLGHFYGNPNRLDLAISIASTNQILLYQSNGDGTFKPGQVVESSVSNVGGMTTADVNKDGKDDLIVAADGSVQVFLGNGDGTFQAPSSYVTHVGGTQGGQIITADLRHNGTQDIIVANPGTSDVSVLLGNNDGTFQPPTNYVLNTGTDTVAAADIDGDGNLDIIAGTLSGGAGTIEFLKGNGNGTLQDTIDYSTPGTEGIGDIASGDLNHDGITDLVTTGSNGSSVDVWIGNGDGTFQPPVSYPVGLDPQGLCLADLNADGNLDIIVADTGDSSTHAIAILLGKGDGTFQPVQFVAGFEGITSINVADFNGDGKLDLAAVSPRDPVVSVYFGNGNGTVQNPVNYGTDPNPTYVSSADFNGDQRPDLLVTTDAPTGGFVELEMNQGHGTFLPPQSDQQKVSANTPANAMGYDVRGVGINDILFVDTESNGFAQCFEDGSGQWNGVVGSPAFEGPIDLALGDFDGDGLQLAILESASDYINILNVILEPHPPGSTDFSDDFSTVPPSVNAGPGPSSMVAADLNNNGTLDLAVADSGGNSITIVRNQSSAVYFLLTAQSTPVAGQPCQFVVTAINAAGQTINNYTGTVHFTSNDPSAVLPADMTLTNGVGVVAATFNTVGVEYLRAADTSDSKITGTSADFSVSKGQVVGPAAKFTIAMPVTLDAGATFSLVVNVYDAAGIPVTNYTGTIHFSSTDPRAVLPADYTFLPSDHGSKTFGGVALITAGTWSLTVTDVANAALTDSRSIINVIADNAASFVVSNFPGQATAGVVSSLTVTALDVYGNVANRYVGTVHFSSTDPKAVLPADYTFLPSDLGSKIFGGFALQTAGTWSLTVTDAASATVTGSETNISVVPASAASLGVSNYSAQATAGAASSITVSVLDAFGNVITGFAGTIHFTSTDKKAGLPSDYPFAVADHGVKTLQATLETAGTQNLTISTVGAPSLVVTTGPISVSPAALANLLFLQQPTTGASGAVMKPAVTVELLDAFGNVETGSTTQVTLAPGVSWGALTLGGNTSVAAVNGVATFSNMIINGSGLGLTLQASASGVPAVPSAKFNNVLLSNILPVVVAPQIYGPAPNTSAEDAFVKGIYRTLLGRDADASGLSYWVGILNGGSARSTLVTAFWNSPENRGREVDTYYQVYLGRSADAGGRSYWINQLQNGADETAIVLSFLLSAEELSAPNNVFVQRLYQGALGRGASASEVSYWVGQLTQGETRQQVANSFVFSSEAAGVAVDSFYEAYLQRTSDPTGRAYWIGQISDRQASYASLAITLLESDEFFKNAAANVP